ncbi:Gfo/Idh/MocA family protein [Glutamicibacter sp. NPDC055491]|uniref:Gfo/Idh/MocA family protein n=1 Tax=Arthrobacter sp. MYb222 TaxID=1848599 RepID=UPI000CFD543E|nr:Gfo/Idh/MocA family oxidoreductase [Arthrobacter sp. MYb222]PQZ89761.1 myo-inositol 2-dehydrogenase [Arthrobacter sp. MYb222]
MNEQRSIGVGLISVGWMGKLHARAYSSVPYAYPELGIKPRLVIAADTEQSRVDFAISTLGFERGTLDYHQVLADPEVDVVSICAPNFLHADMAIAAAEAGKHFWIEKPAGRSLAETQAIEQAAIRNGVVTSVGFNYRHAPAIARARQLVQEGRLGSIANVRASFLAGYAADPRAALSWRFNRELAGSGVLADLFSHAADLCSHVVGHIQGISASTNVMIPSRPKLSMGQGTHFDLIEGGEQGEVENEDYAAALVRFSPEGVADRAIGTIEASRVAVGPQCGYRLEIYGMEGSVKWDFERMNELEVVLGRDNEEQGFTTVIGSPKHGEYSRFQPGPGNAMGFDDLKTIEAKKFLLAVAGGEKTNSTIADAVAAAAVVEAAEASAASGTWQALDEPVRAASVQY